jgi:hypothetical protein
MYTGSPDCCSFVTSLTVGNRQGVGFQKIGIFDDIHNGMLNYTFTAYSYVIS